MKRVIKKIKKVVAPEVEPVAVASAPIPKVVVETKPLAEPVVTSTKSSAKKFIVGAVAILVFVVGVFIIRQVGKSFVGEVTQTIIITENNSDVVATTTENSSLVGRKAPAFSLAGNQATTTRLLDLLNKPLLVVFWTTWQSASADQLRAFDQYLLDNKNIKVNIIFINHQEDDLLVGSFLRRAGYDLPVLFDETGGVGNAWQVHTVPTTYLVGTDGIIKEKIIGNYPVVEVVDKLLNINH